MDAALLLAALASRAGDHVDFLAHDRVTRAGVFNASRTELLAQLVAAMAPLQPALVESDASAMVAAVQRRVRRRALVVLLTDLNASALDEGLMSVLPQLSAKHQVLLAAVADPRVDRLAAGPRGCGPGVRRGGGRAGPQRPAGDRVAAAARGSRRRRRPARGAGAGAGRPLSGDEGHRPALTCRHDVGRVLDVAGLPRSCRLAAEVEYVGQEGHLGGDTDARCARMSATATASPAPRSARTPAARRPVPTATATTARPCSASTWPRGRSPGAITDQPSRIPAAAARNTAVSSSSPCGVSRPRKTSPLPASNIRPGDHAEVGGVLEQHVRDRDAEQDREPDALRGHPGVVHPHLQRERPRRVLAVVGGEIVVDQLRRSRLGFRSSPAPRGCPPPRSAITAVTAKNATAVPSHHRQDR